MDKRIIKVSLALVIICTVSGVVLSLVNSITEKKIEKNSLESFNSALTTLVNGGVEEVDVQIIPGLHKISKVAKGGSNKDLSIGSENVVKKSGILSYFEVIEKDVVIGYLVSVMDKGYGGDIKLLVYYDNYGSVLNAQLLDNSETPGIGKKAENPTYMDKFKNKGSSKNPIPVNKGMLSSSEADSVSGATVTFSGVSRAIKKGSDFVKTNFNNTKDVYTKKKTKEIKKDDSIKIKVESRVSSNVVSGENND